MKFKKVPQPCNVYNIKKEFCMFLLL
uniref:Uncharacterized protein n=1 Tax=Anguilla anguilla TaxID=7936 RepID=A0A0E9W1U1_ANGAN